MGSVSHSTSTVVPSDLVNDRDHGALVTVAAALCIVFSLLCFVARLVVRWPWKNLFGRDDAVTGAALVCVKPSVSQSHLLLTEIEVLLDGAVNTRNGGRPGWPGQDNGWVVKRGSI